MCHRKTSSGARRFARHAAHASGCDSHHACVRESGDAPGSSSRFAENVLTTVHDANIGSIFGIGFPAWTGGALQFIYGMGIDAFLKRAAELAAKHGTGFAVSAEVADALRRHEPHY